MLTAFVPREVEIVELAAVVVADQSCHPLEVLWLELDDRRCAEAVGLLAARDERLREHAADRLAAVEPQMARTHLQAEQVFRPRSSQPLEVDRQYSLTELLSDHRHGPRLQRHAGRCGHVNHREAFATGGTEPAIRTPRHRLDGCLAPKRAAAAIPQGPTAQ